MLTLFGGRLMLTVALQTLRDRGGRVVYKIPYRHARASKGILHTRGGVKMAKNLLT